MGRIPIMQMTTRTASSENRVYRLLYYRAYRAN